MKQLASLTWKEWREASPYLWIGLGVFLGLPLIGCLEALFQHIHGIDIEAIPWVFAFGGVLAVFVGVGVVCRDFSGHLEDFWRSRPLTVSRLVLVKYLVGLAVTLAAGLLPLIVEGVDDRNSGALQLAVWLPFLWTAIYSIGFATACLLRRTAHAATVALAATIMLCGLPFIIPPLRFLQIPFEIQNAGALYAYHPDVYSLLRYFGSGMLVIALTALLLALIAMRREWRIDAGRKLIYASIAATFLILIGSAGYQLGTNLPVLQQIDLPAKENLDYLHMSGDKGFAVTEQPKTFNDGARHILESQYLVRSIHLGKSAIELGHPIEFHVTDPDPSFDFSILFSLPNSPVQYYTLPLWRDGSDYCVLHACQLDNDLDNEVQSFPLLRRFGQWPWVMRDAPLLYSWQNRLYVIGDHLVVLDITQPLTPRLISDEPFTYYFTEAYTSSGKMIINLPGVPGLSPRQRLEAVFQGESDRRELDILEGDILYTDYGSVLEAWRLSTLTEHEAEFQSAGLYQPSLLENIFGFSYFSDLHVANGVVYVGQGKGTWWNGYMSYHQTIFNGRITVLDTTGRQPMHVIGHFAAPGVQMAVPLPDGRAIVGGSKLWLVGPPPKHGG